MKKLPKQEYTTEFKEQAVAQVACINYFVGNGSDFSGAHALCT